MFVRYTTAWRWLAAAWALCLWTGAMAQTPGNPEARATTEIDVNKPMDDADFEEDTPPVYDPLEVVNRPLFKFNDKLYTWVLHPIARGYRKITPDPVEKSVTKFLRNLDSPVRVANSLLQGKIKSSGRETGRFLINSTVGAAGLFNPATSVWHVAESDEDLGQTLGRWGLKPGPYLVLPLLGPTTARDGVGMAGDYFVSIRTYLFPHNPELRAGMLGIHGVDRTSNTMDAYNQAKQDAIDPYTYIRDAFSQNRQGKVEK